MGGGDQARGGQPAQVHQGVERRAAQLAGYVGGRPPAVDQVQDRLPPRADRPGPVRADGGQRGGVGRRVRPDAVQQRTPPHRLPFQRGDGDRPHVAHPVPGAVAEVAGRAAGGEGEVGGVEEGAQVAELQLALGEHALRYQRPAHRPLRVGLRALHGPLPPLRVDRAAGGEQHVDAGGGRALGVHHPALGQVERAALADQDAGGVLGGQPVQHRRDAAPRALPGVRGVTHREARRGRVHGRHPSTSRPARSPRRIRASARLPSSRSSQRWRKTLLS